MTAVPGITSLGPPPDLHAKRVVGEMLDHLQGEQRRLIADCMSDDRLKRVQEELAKQIAERKTRAKLKHQAG